MFFFLNREGKALSILSMEFIRYEICNNSQHPNHYYIDSKKILDR